MIGYPIRRKISDDNILQISKFILTLFPGEQLRAMETWLI